MFNVGEKVVYPLHGAGIVEAIEEKEVLGEKRKYLVITIPIGNMTVMIPIERVAECGLRKVISEEEVERVMGILSSAETPMAVNWNNRYRSNMEKIKSGDVFSLAEVVKNLMRREREKGLSTGEKKMLENAKRILVSELMLAEDEEEKAINSVIEKLVM